jgi:hypothetical protein
MEIRLAWDSGDDPTFLALASLSATLRSVACVLIRLSLSPKSLTIPGTATSSEKARREDGAYRIVEPGKPSRKQKSPSDAPVVEARK